MKDHKHRIFFETMIGISHFTVIRDIPADDYDKYLDDIDEMCCGWWARSRKTIYHMRRHSYEITFYFSDERDAMMLKLAR
jgi:hypothetical protein